MMLSALMSFFYMWLSSFPSTTYWRGCLSSLVCSCLVCHRSGAHRRVGLSPGFLSCSIDLYVCFCTGTILSWLLYPWLILWLGVCTFWFSPISPTTSLHLHPIRYLYLWAQFLWAKILHIIISRIPSRSIQLQMARFPLFLWLINIVYIHHAFFTHLSFDGRFVASYTD